MEVLATRQHSGTEDRLIGDDRAAEDVCRRDGPDLSDPDRARTHASGKSQWPDCDRQPGGPPENWKGWRLSKWKAVILAALRKIFITKERSGKERLIWAPAY